MYFYTDYPSITITVNTNNFTYPILTNLPLPVYNFAYLDPVLGWVILPKYLAYDKIGSKIYSSNLNYTFWKDTLYP
jgi:hypothetical protein